jgi:hypothetical protein
VSKDDLAKNARNMMFPVKTIKINGVAIEIRSLAAIKVTEAVEFIFDFSVKAMVGVITQEFLADSMGTLYRYLNQCVTIPDIPDMLAQDLPFSVMPDVIDAFLDYTLNPGNWRSRAQKWRETYGMGLVMSPAVENPSTP